MFPRCFRFSRRFPLFDVSAFLAVSLFSPFPFSRRLTARLLLLPLEVTVLQTTALGGFCPPDYCTWRFISSRLLHFEVSVLQTTALGGFYPPDYCTWRFLSSRLLHLEVSVLQTTAFGGYCPPDYCTWRFLSSRLLHLEVSVSRLLHLEVSVLQTTALGGFCPPDYCTWRFLSSRLLHLEVSVLQTTALGGYCPPDYCTWRFVLQTTALGGFCPPDYCTWRFLSSRLLHLEVSVLQTTALGGFCPPNYCTWSFVSPQSTLWADPDIWYRKTCHIINMLIGRPKCLFVIRSVHFGLTVSIGSSCTDYRIFHEKFPWDWAWTNLPLSFDVSLSNVSLPHCQTGVILLWYNKAIRMVMTSIYKSACLVCNNCGLSSVQKVHQLELKPAPRFAVWW